MLAALILFALAYVLMLCFSKYRTYVALAFGVVFVLTRLLPPEEILDAIDWNVLLILIGTMGLVELFIESKMPALLADLIMERVPNVRWAAVCLALFAGIISAFVDNVATVLMVAPVAMEICKKLDTNPVPFIIGVAVSSNLQGAATMVGDATAIMLGSYADMNFLDFFWYKGRPSIFFAVEIGALLSAAIMFFLFRGETAPVPKGGPRTQVTDYLPTILLAGTIVLLILASALPERPALTNGFICFGLMLVGMAANWLKKRKKAALLEPLKGIDFETVGLLVGLFLMIGGLSAQGVIDAAAGLLARVGGGSLFVLYTVIVWGSVVISAFVDNIPYVATMLPVISQLSASMGIDPTLLYFGLLSGATLGGNCTPIGASANITGIGILRRAGYQVKNRDFMRIGVPFTLAAILPAYLYLWIMYH
ncbi:MAG: arsenic transporter [Oscillospiraceae bacterium]|nr:arsenic transporter [Oscillospiraceae bacterium]